MARQIVILTTAPAQTRALGRNFARNIQSGGVAALIGTLGSGKTTFVQGLGVGLRLRRKITSPTFIKMARYRLPHTDRWFYHFDLYRLRHRTELMELGLSDILRRKDNVIVIEWPEKIKALLPPRTKWIKFTHDRSDPKTRIIKIH